MKYDLCIIGGGGHVGLPLGVAFANKGVKTVLLDVNQKALEKIKSGIFPFKEENGKQELAKALKKKTLEVSLAPEVIGQSGIVLLVVGTPVDEYLNPDFKGVHRVLDAYFPHFKDGHILILRSTIYPGTSEILQRYFHERDKKVSIAFCPERIVEGRAFREFEQFPQIVSAFDTTTLDRVGKLFRKITARKIVLAKPVEAELAKLFSNAWRYIQFAVANQFFMVAEDYGLNYNKIYEAMRDDYPRMKDLPRPGFAAGPCLFKDTMQLSVFSNNNFFLGHSAMLINEGLPQYIIQKLKRKFTHIRPEAEMLEKPMVRVAGVLPITGAMSSAPLGNDLRSKVIGILGMAFKAESDDPRDSLSFKMKKIAATECKKVLCHDPYIKDASLSDLTTLLRESDIVILAAPHKVYRAINPRLYPAKTFVDIWNFWKK